MTDAVVDDRERRWFVPSAGRVGDPDRLSALHAVGLLDTEREEAFDRLTRLATAALDVPRAAITLVDRDRQFLKSCVGMPPDVTEKRETPLEASFCRHVVEAGDRIFIADTRRDRLTAGSSPVAEGALAYAGVPLTTESGHTLGTLCVVDEAPRVWTERDVELLEGLARSVMSEIDLHLARARERRRADDLEQLVERRTASLRRANDRLDRARWELSRSREETVWRLAVAMEARSGETGQHANRVGALCGALAERVGLDAGSVALLRIASPLHDVGKIAIPDAILNKPGPLSASERLVMETHTTIGHQLLSGSGEPLLDLAALVALTHHERIDGDGYPEGRRGEGIPIEGRIVAVADVFDALTNDRVYRPAMRQDDALAVMELGRGSQFDPAVLDPLEDVLATLPDDEPAGRLERSEHRAAAG